MFGSEKAAGRRLRAYERELVVGIEVVEVHVPAPLGKREPDGLSAEDAYNAIALSTFHVGTLPRETMDDG